MASERKPGSNQGGAIINWGEAFLFYASLPSERRSYRAVADQYAPVSVRTVERHGRQERWNERARQLDRDAADTAAARLRDERAEKLLDFERLIEATTVTYANQLREGKVRVSPADLLRLHTLRTTLWAESDDATTGAEETTAPAAVAADVDPAERKLQVLQALRDAGALVQLLDLSPTDTRDDPDMFRHSEQGHDRPSSEAAEGGNDG